MLRAYSGKSHGGFRGTALLFRAVRLSLSAGSELLAISARAWPLVCLPSEIHPGTLRGAGFSAFRQSDRRVPVFFRLAGSVRRRRLPCPPSPLSGRDRTALFPWNLSTAWKLPVGISTFHPRQTGTDTNKSTNKNGVVHVLPRFTPVHDRRTKKKKESPRRRLQTAGNFYGFLGQGRAVSVSAMAAPCSAISDSAIGKKRNVSLKMAPFQ